MSAPNVPRINLPTLADIVCQECQNKIQVRLPRPRLANAIDSTIIVFVHERLDKCPHCSAVYVFNVSDINEHGQLGFAWMLIKQESPIVPGTQTNLSQAVANDDVSKKIKLN
jgi:hypothetical protein